MATNSDLKRWYKIYGIEPKDFVRYDDMFRVLVFDAIDDFHAVNYGQMKKYVSEQLTGYEKALNLENGQGKDSIIQTYTGEVDDTHFANINTGKSAVVFGEANNNSGSCVFQWGKHTINAYDNVAVGGYYNDNKDNTLLELGNGTAEVRSNAFEVLVDGRAKVQSAPIEANDVVRKRELDRKVNVVNDTVSKRRVYAISPGTANTYTPYLVSTPETHTVMYRDETGRSQIKTPIENEDIANKKYVDGAINAENDLLTLTIIVSDGDVLDLSKLTFTQVDWGDNNQNSQSTHTYQVTGEVIVKVYGVVDMSATGIFLNNALLKSVIIPKSVSTLGIGIFRNCSNLVEIDLSNVKIISNIAFYNCGLLANVILPETVTDIGNDAFYNCINLQTIEFKQKTPITYNASWFKNAVITKIIVPYTSLDAYKNAWTTEISRLDAIAYLSDVNQNKLTFEYKEFSANTQYIISRNGYYMCYSNNADLKLCKKDGTVVVENAKQIQFMASPLADNLTSTSFKVCGIYWTGGVLSGVEGFRRTSDDGGYITAPTEFYISEMKK